MNLYILSVIVALALILLLALVLRKGKMRTPDYRGLFWLGLVFLLVYVFSLFYGNEDSISNVFMILGIVYLTVGLSRRDEWGKRKVLDDPQRKLMMGFTLAGLIVLMLSVAVFYLLR
ncbi:hypothetical protein ACFLZY_00815 [Patescibacteria group bacterium]